MAGKDGAFSEHVKGMTNAPSVPRQFLLYTCTVSCRTDILLRKDELESDLENALEVASTEEELLKLSVINVSRFVAVML